MSLGLSNPALLREAALVGGQWVAANGAGIAVNNLATGETIGHVPNLGAGEPETAIVAAATAQKDRARRTARERSQVLRRWYDLIMTHQDDLDRILTAEQGKPRAEARGEIAYGASFTEWFAEEARRAYGDITTGHATDKRRLSVKQPIGVVATITPRHFPNAMITRKAGPALAAGCAMVRKPAAQTPFSATTLAVLAEEAGVPPELFSLLTGPSQVIGRAMTDSPAVRKLTFTGSTKVCAQFYGQCAAMIKKLALELGGNAPSIVFDDADLDAAVEGAVIAKFRNNGQTCVCANRIFVQAGIFDAFADKLATKVETLFTGNGFDDGVVFGPLIDAAVVEKVAERVADATFKSATLTLGCKPHTLSGTFFCTDDLDWRNLCHGHRLRRKLWPRRTAFSLRHRGRVDRSRQCHRVWPRVLSKSRDHARVWRVSEALDYGMVGVNTGIISTAEAPFGGVKLSGLGRGVSRHGLNNYLELKYIRMGGIDPAEEV